MLTTTPYFLSYQLERGGINKPPQYKISEGKGWCLGLEDQLFIFDQYPPTFCAMGALLILG